MPIEFDLTLEFDLTFGFFFLKKNSWKKREGAKNYVVILRSISLLTLGGVSSIDVTGDDLFCFVDELDFEDFNEGYAIVNFSLVPGSCCLRDVRCLSYYSFEEFRLIRHWVEDNHINDIMQLLSKLLRDDDED